nr:lysophospholipid acyltransferase family protein [Mycolicibacter sinensis]
MHGAAERVSPAVVAARLALVLLLIPVLPLLAVPLPGRVRFQRGCCRLVLRCFGVRVTTTGGPVRNLPGMLVVSAHTSWLDVFVVGAVSPGTFVARADLISWPGIGALARLLRIIPIDRDSLRGLPAVVDAVTARLRAGRIVVAFPEGTTWCGRAHGRYYPAMFQAAVDASRPVQPLRLSYHHADGSRSTLPAFVGDDTLVASMRRLITARRTVARVHVASLQLPGSDRRELAARCQASVSCRAQPRRQACIFC